MTTDPVTIEVPQGALLFPNIYEKDRYGKYGVTFPTSILVGVLEDHVVDGLHYNRRGGVAMSTARSMYRPQVKAQWAPNHHFRTFRETSAVDQLVPELQRLDAQNLPRDHVFKDRRVTVDLKPYHYCNPRFGEGISLALYGITVYL